MPRILRAAVLECDTPIVPILERYGTYGNLFESLLQDGLKGIGKDQEVTVQVTKYDVVAACVYPPADQVDVVLLTGSKHDAFADTPWIASLTNYIAILFQHTTTPIIGICFGHQIIARALGARVGRSDAGWEVAVEPVALNETGQKLFGKETLFIHQMHRDIAYEVPNGCVNLGSTPRCAVQGFYLPRRILTVQGHPEYHEFIETKLIEARHRQGIFDDALFASGMKRVGDPHDGGVVAQTICRMALQLD